VKIPKSELKRIIKEEILAESITGGPEKPWMWDKRGRSITISDLEKNKQEMKVVGFLERALETLEFIGDDREETYGTLRNVRDMIYNSTGLNEMKISKSELKQIIKEELKAIYTESASGLDWKPLGPGPDSTPEQRQEYMSMQKAGFRAGVRGEEPEYPDDEVYMESYEEGRTNRKLRFAMAAGLFLEEQQGED